MILSFVNVIDLIIFLEVAIIAHVLSRIFERRPYYWLRLIGSMLVCSSAAYFLPVVNSGGFVLSWLYAVFMYLVLLFLAVGSVAFCVKGIFINYLYCAAAGYALHHLGSNVNSLLSHFFPVLALTPDFGFPGIMTQIVLFGLVLGLSIYFSSRGKGVKIAMNTKKVVYISAVVVLLDITISSLLMLAGVYQITKLDTAVGDIYALCSSLLAVFIILVLLKQQRLETEVAIMNRLYEENVRQYEISKATMESLHDFKHRLNAIMQGQLALSEEERNAISEGIFYLDSQTKSGNETLNIILGEKKMLCHQYDIEFDSMCDGSKISFMERYDIFSLFGNALSNAIEAVNRLEEGKPRYISLIVKGSGNFVSIHLENSFNDRLTMKDGLPVTVKPDKHAHGFGVKSIQNITEKYNGNMTISHQEGVFILDVILPNPPVNAA